MRDPYRRLVFIWVFFLKMMNSQILRRPQDDNDGVVVDAQAFFYAMAEQPPGPTLG
jgi:hypothetical protein